MNAVPGPSTENGSLAEKAYRSLEELLVTLKLAPGELLGEKDLMDKAGIGRTPVREAIQKLSAEGLLQVLPRKGLMVTPLRRSDLCQIIEARRVMERLLVVKATERADASQKQQLERLAQAFENVDQQPSNFFELDRKLDQLLAATCGNVFLVQALLPLHAHSRRLWFLFRAELDTAEAAQLHANLARAVSIDDSAGAIRALNGIISILEGLQARLEARS